MTINQGAIGRESSDDPISSYLASYLSEIRGMVFQNHPEIKLSYQSASQHARWSRVTVLRGVSKRAGHEQLFACNLRILTVPTVCRFVALLRCFRESAGL